MTFVALFKQPGVFKAGAALRPVWTGPSTTTNTPQHPQHPDIDPEAYPPSPIEYADGLRDNLLIAHGMIDDNVLFKDSRWLTQKLIELRKTGWSIAPYPMERHGFVHPDAWYDEYRHRRIVHRYAEPMTTPARAVRRVSDGRRTPNGGCLPR